MLRYQSTGLAALERVYESCFLQMTTEHTCPVVPEIIYTSSVM